MNDDTMIESIRAGLEQSRSGWTTESKKLFVLLKVLDELKALRADLVPQSQTRLHNADLQGYASIGDPEAFKQLDIGVELDHSAAQTNPLQNSMQNSMQSAGRK